MINSWCETQIERTGTGANKIEGSMINLHLADQNTDQRRGGQELRNHNKIRKQSKRPTETNPPATVTYEKIPSVPKTNNQHFKKNLPISQQNKPQATEHRSLVQNLMRRPKGSSHRTEAKTA